MAAPRPGQRGYKGPVHEAVRNAAGAVGITFGKPSRRVDRERYEKARAVARPSSTKAERLSMNQMRLRQATAMQRSKGTYDTYDPLKSTAQNLRVRREAASTARAKKYSAKTNRMAANLRKAEAAGKTSRAKRLTRKITRRERGDNA